MHRLDTYIYGANQIWDLHMERFKDHLVEYMITNGALFETTGFMALLAEELYTLGIWMDIDGLPFSEVITNSAFNLFLYV